MKVLFVWDVKSRGSPATRFYRELCGYDYETIKGKSHSNGVLDELPKGKWEFVSRSALLVDERYASRVVSVFRKFDEYIEWKNFRVVEGE
ncbi:MAG: hypothetical protein J7J17_02695 [Hadesarchaea archaeon]|nr:hypothetical protein [Hadesarchaea archaeon]